MGTKKRRREDCFIWIPLKEQRKFHIQETEISVLENQNLFQFLPIEVISFIFSWCSSWLSYQNLVKLRTVCKRFHEASDAPIVWKNVLVEFPRSWNESQTIIKPERFHKITVGNSKILPQIIQRCINLTLLHLSYCSLENSDLRGLKNLKSLQLTLGSLTGSLLPPSLKTINAELTVLETKQILKSCPNLTRLSIGEHDCRESLEYLQALMESGNPSMIALRLPQPEEPLTEYDVSADFWAKFFEKFDSLEELYFSSCCDGDDSGPGRSIPPLPKSIKMLTFYAGSVNLKEIFDHIACDSAMTFLCITSAVMDMTFNAAIISKLLLTCPSLTSLELSGCGPSLNKALLGKLFVSLNKNIKRIDIDWKETYPKSLHRVIPLLKYNQLLVLCLSCDEHYTILPVKSMTMLLKNCPKLEILFLPCKEPDS